MKKPRVNILYAPGTNCHLELAAAFRLVGAESTFCLLTADLIDGKKKLTDCDLIGLPGGWSFGDHISAVSAGSKPKGAPHPLALKTLQRHGIDTEGLASKSWDGFTDRPFDLVVTLCGSAAKETCPSMRP